MILPSMRYETLKILTMEYTTNAERQQILICNEQRTQQLEQEREKLEEQGAVIYTDDPRQPQSRLIGTELYWLGLQKREYLESES